MTEPEPLTITDIRKMSPEEVLADKDRVDRFMETWDGSEPEPVEGEAAQEKKLTPQQQYSAELAALSPRDRERRLREDWETGRAQKAMRGEA